MSRQQTPTETFEFYYEQLESYGAEMPNDFRPTFPKRKLPRYFP